MLCRVHSKIPHFFYIPTACTGGTIVTLSQLNREVEKRTSGRPILSDLKESVWWSNLKRHNDRFFQT